MRVYGQVVPAQAVSCVEQVVPVQLVHTVDCGSVRQSALLNCPVSLTNPQ